MKHIFLESWSEFDTSLRAELSRLQHRGHVVVRNFEIETNNGKKSVDRLALLLETGTDRDASSRFWDEPEHDYQHGSKSAREPEQIIYAFKVDPAPIPYQVHHGDEPEPLDLTEGLHEGSAVAIYDDQYLHRVAKNEYWFNKPPLMALLMVFTLTGDIEIPADESM
jgi:hypothetical protein